MLSLILKFWNTLNCMRDKLNMMENKTHINTMQPGDTYVSVNWIIIGSDNGLAPVYHQAITPTYGKLLSIGPLRRTKLSLNQNPIVN